MAATDSLISPYLVGLIKKIKPKVTEESWAETAQLEKLQNNLPKTYEVKGRGAFSIVFKNKNLPKKVIKITLAKQDGYHKYVEWVAKNKEKLPKECRKHLPRIYATKLLGDIRITVLEELQSRNWRNRNLSSSSTFEQIYDIVEEAATAEGVRNDTFYTDTRNIMMRGKTPVITDPWARPINRGTHG